MVIRSRIVYDQRAGLDKSLHYRKMSCDEQVKKTCCDTMFIPGYER